MVELVSWLFWWLHVKTICVLGSISMMINHLAKSAWWRRQMESNNLSKNHGSKHFNFVMGLLFSRNHCSWSDRIQCKKWIMKVLTKATTNKNKYNIINNCKRNRVTKDWRILVDVTLQPSRKRYKINALFPSSGCSNNDEFLSQWRQKESW